MRTSILALLLLGGAAPLLAQDPPAPPPGGAMVAGMLMRADANGDGVVTRAEATAAADARFDRMDANRDGTATPEEMRAARDAMRGNADRGPPPPPDGARPGPPMPPERATTRDEARARALAAFDRADLNHDGSIDGREMAQLRDVRGPGRPGERPAGDMPPPPPQD